MTNTKMIEVLDQCSNEKLGFDDVHVGEADAVADGIDLQPPYYWKDSNLTEFHPNERPFC